MISPEVFTLGFFLKKKFEKYLVVRLYGYTFVSMNEEKRKARAYKVKDSHYYDAFNRATDEGGHLANLIENVVIGYANGLNVILTNRKSRQKASLNNLNLRSNAQ